MGLNGSSFGNGPNTGIQGQPGPRGRSIFSGDRVPQPTDGEPGDFYFDKLHRKFYGPKLQNVGWDMDDWVFIGIPSEVIGNAEQATIDALAATAAANAMVIATDAAKQGAIDATTAATAATAAAQAVVTAGASILAAKDTAVGAAADALTNSIAAAASAAAAAASVLVVNNKATGVAGKNLFNPADPDVAIGFFPNHTTGVLQANATYNTTGFIPVVAGLQYSVSSKHYWCWYNSSKVFISGTSDADSGKTKTAPAGAAFARASAAASGAWPVFQFEQSSAPTAYEAYTSTIFLAPAALRDLMVTTSKIAAQAVNVSKTSFFKAGKNLFNKNAAIIGSFMSEAGAIVVNSGFDYSELIPVTPGQLYTGRGTNNGMRFTTYFDSNQQWVTGGSNSTVTSFTPPAGVAYVVVTISHVDLSSFQLEAGAQTSYEPFQYKFSGPFGETLLAQLTDNTVTTAKMVDAAVTPAKTAFLKAGKNLFNKYSATLSYFMDPNSGALVSNASFDVGDFIPVTPGTQYYAKGVSQGMRFYTYFDANKVVMAGGGGDASTGVFTITPPVGAAYVRPTIFHGELANFQFEVGAAQTALESFTYKFLGPNGEPLSTTLQAGAVGTTELAALGVTPSKTNFFQPGKNLFNKAAATLGYFRGHDGSTVASASFYYSDYIPVTPGQTFYGKGGSTGMRFVTYYNANKGFVSGGINGDTFTFTVPAGVYYIIFTGYISAIDVFQLELGSAATSYAAYGWVIKLLSGEAISLDGGSTGATSLWNNKAWASLGDSITAGGTWQAYVSGVLGLVNTNFGIGGTRISGANGDTSAMCQDTRINAIPTTIDVLSMMGGTNDWAQNIALGSANSTDPTTFNGALNTFAQKAFARWPTKKIFLVTTPYGEIPDYVPRGWVDPAHNTLGLTTNDYAQAIRDAASRLNMPLIDVARDANWGTTNIQTALGGSTTDHLHPAGGSQAAKGIAAAHIGKFKAVEPVV